MTERPQQAVAAAFDSTLDEIERTQQRIFPLDPVRAAALLCEEAGETIAEALDLTRLPRLTPRGPTIERLRKEAVHTAAVAVRLIVLADYLAAEAANNQEEAT